MSYVDEDDLKFLVLLQRLSRARITGMSHHAWLHRTVAQARGSVCAGRAL